MNFEISNGRMVLEIEPYDFTGEELAMLEGVGIHGSNGITRMLLPNVRVDTKLLVFYLPSGAVMQLIEDEHGRLSIHSITIDSREYHPDRV